MILLINIVTNTSAQQNTKDIKWIDGDDSGRSAQIPYWFKESFLEIELDIEEALEAERLLMLYFHQDRHGKLLRQLHIVKSRTVEPLLSLIRELGLVVLLC